MDPGDGHTTIELGKILLLLGRREEAEGYLKIGMHFTPDMRGRREAAALLASIGVPPEDVEAIAEPPSASALSQGVKAKV
jgi:hypothetical protein